jgi:hypothetical protein
MLKRVALLCVIILFGVIAVYAQQKNLDENSKVIGTIKAVLSAFRSNSPAILYLEEYPNKMFRVNFQDAIDYGIVILEKKNSVIISQRGVSGWKVKLTFTGNPPYVTSLERLDK